MFLQNNSFFSLSVAETVGSVLFFLFFFLPIYIDIYILIFDTLYFLQVRIFRHIFLFSRWATQAGFQLIHPN